ncbi:MAG: hypothetical protein IK115_00330 [Lachnospiraceae bacterium]|nr:hypothetical protein [Lachnospiraceae bacterium]
MKVRHITAMLLVAALLAGCGSSGTEDKGPVEATEGETEEVTPTEVPTAAPTPEEAPEEEEYVPPYYVEGSGSYFVRLSDGVYFHEYTKEVFDDLALNGDFLTYIIGDGDTYLCRYDEESGEVTRVAEDDCIGALYWCGDRFYCDRFTGGTGYVCTITPDGDCEQLCPGEVMGTSMDGGWIAIWEYEPDGDASMIRVLDEEGKEAYRLDTDYYSFGYCGLDMNTLIFRNVRENGMVEFYSCDADGPVLLGTLAKTGGYGNPRCHQMIRNEVADYLMLTWYGGPTDAYESCQVVSLRPGEEGSLELVQDGYDPAVMPNAAEFEIPDMRFADGELVYERCAAGTASLTEGRHGDLWLYNDHFDQGAISKAFIDYPDRRDLRILTSQLLGDQLYLMVAAVEYDPSEDYSWMRYYRYKDKMYYLRVPAKEDSKVESIYGADWSTASSFDTSGYEAFIGTWRMDEAAPEGNAAEREPARMDLWLWFDESHMAGIIDNPQLGGLYYLESSVLDGEYLLFGTNELHGHNFSASIDGDELTVTFLQKLQSETGSDAMSWTGYFHKVSQEEYGAEWGVEE